MPEAAHAQRAAENLITSAQDAFGSSIGNERIGLYSPTSARGFSPIAAGNVRLEGLYFDLQGLFPDRMVSGSTMRVGLSAQGYAFPAPSGIADFALRPSAGDAVLSTNIVANTFGGHRWEIDGHMEVSPTLSVAGGLSYESEALHYGGNRQIAQGGVIARWKPLPTVELTPFWSVYDSSGQEAQLVVFPSGSFLPPRVKRRRLRSVDWSDNQIRYVDYGLLSTVQAKDWTIRAGVFRSVTDNPWSFSDLSYETDENGIGDRVLIAERNRRFASTSGEVRVSRSVLEGNRRHGFYLAARARMQVRRYGGGQRINQGRLSIEQTPSLERPEFAFGQQTEDRVRQFTGGLGYQGLWSDVGELSLGIQRTSYAKEVDRSDIALPTSRSRPWLMNAALTVHGSKRLAFYAGYAKGLEESPIAPPSAVNRDEAPPAIITKQMDAGVRWVLTRDLRLVAGVFDIRKPYFALDASQNFGNLGDLRNRGVEFSLAGKLGTRVSVVVGLVLMNPEVKGPAVKQGLVGPRALDTFKRYVSANLEYAVPWFDDVSVDLRYEHYGNRAADRLNTFVIPSRHVVNLGARYRFRIAGAPTSLRVQLAQATDGYAHVLAGEGFIFNVPRRTIVSLTSDW